MFKKRTVIVVGAGASKEARLPIGSELKQQIANRLLFSFDELAVRPKIGDPCIYDALKLRASRKGIVDASQPLAAARLVADSMPMASSIDNFIDSHRGNQDVELCGKLAIVRCILTAENGSLLHSGSEVPGRPFDHNRVSDTWYNYFMQLLTENCTVDDIGDRLSRITFVVFNYDRCVEHYLYHSLRKFYDLAPNEAREIVRKLNVIHPYGTVGLLGWEDGRNEAVEYGAPIDVHQLLVLASRIKTFTEGIDPETGHIDRIREAMLGAEMVLYLGFAFHSINLRILFDHDNIGGSNRDAQHFATAFGISDSDSIAIQEELKRLTSGRSPAIAVRNNLTCSSLFGEYWRTLSLN